MSAVLERGAGASRYAMTPAQMAARIEQLEEELRYAQALLVPAATLPAEYKLTRLETRLVLCLAAHSPATMTRESILAALYGHADIDVEIKNVDVFIFYVRQKLKPFGLRIETVRGLGYCMPKETRAALLEGGAT